MSRKDKIFINKIERKRCTTFLYQSPELYYIDVIWIDYKYILYLLELQLNINIKFKGRFMQIISGQM